MELDLPDVDATERLGAQLAEVARAGDVVFLHGQLGAGKTSLARGFLRQFFADSALEVPSPSYLICFTYTDADAEPADTSADEPSRLGRGLRSAGRARLPDVQVLHLDPYRLPEGKVASLIDLPPAFKSHICLIEWPERLGAQLVTADQPGRLEVTLGGIGPQAQGRRVSFTAVGERWQSQLSEWSAAGGQLASPAPIPARISAVAGGNGSANGDGGRCSTGLVPIGPPSEWIVLGIESSCDDTGAAVVRGDGKVLGEVLASQAGVHETYGGVVPRLAQVCLSHGRGHTRSLSPRTPDPGPHPIPQSPHTRSRYSQFRPPPRHCRHPRHPHLPAIPASLAILAFLTYSGHPRLPSPSSPHP